MEIAGRCVRVLVAQDVLDQRDRVPGMEQFRGREVVNPVVAEGRHSRQ